MPIKGLSEKPRLPRLGKIHLGFRDEAKRGAPTATNYFVCPPEIKKVFGDKPQELPIRIPLLDEEKIASQYYKCYSQTRGLVCKGDGETANCLIDTDTGAIANRDSKDVAMKEVACQGRECPHYNKQCREIMCFQFMLPDVPGIGVWQIDTSSINGIRNINSNLTILAEFCKQTGINILSIPLMLTLEPLPLQDPGGKKKTVNVLNLRSNLVLSELLKIPKQLTEPEPEVPMPDEPEPELLVPYNQEQASKGRDPETIKNINDLYKACREEFGLQPKEVLSELNYASKGEITDPAECYRRIAAVRQ